MTDHDIRVRVAELLGWSLPRNPLSDRGIPPDGLGYRILPDYPRDLNAAVAAVKARGHGWSLSWDEQVGVLVAIVAGETIDTAETCPARALCLALLRAEGVEQ